MNSVRNLVNIHSVEQLHDALKAMDEQFLDELAPLEAMLELDVMSIDMSSVAQHCAGVERWRVRVVKMHAIMTGFVEYSKSSVFSLPKEKGITEFDREGHKRRMSAGFTALQTWLDGLVSSIDSRVNLCKRLIDGKMAA